MYLTLKSPFTSSLANLEIKHKATGVSVQAAYRGPIHCVATILQQEGLAGLFRGTTAMLLRDVPGYCLYFIPYALVSVWITSEECLSPTPFAAWMAGGIAGMNLSFRMLLGWVHIMTLGLNMVSLLLHWNDK